MRTTLIIIACLAILGCKNEEQKEVQVTNPQDYNFYLSSTQSPSLEEALAQKQFWSYRINDDTTGVGDIGPLAGAYEQIFAETGEVSYLYSAEKLYHKGIAVAAVNYRDGLERGLAHNYISQHRFKEAQEVLQNSYDGVSAKVPTKLMLFDVAMELGDYETAYQYLSEFKDMSDYNYLIRISKWSDHLGDLDSAIRYMEKAKEVAESRKSKPLMIWTYSNIADYYGHAGRIEDSYQHYLKTLELQPDNAYAKKGIAWIVYAAEHNPEEAHRILDAIMRSHHVPEYHLLKSEWYAFQNNPTASEAEIDTFIKMVNEGNYGVMYNSYLIEILSERTPERALTMAEQEIQQRATPEIYHLLALAQLRAGNKTQALETISTQVVGKTFEPMALYHSALVYKANGMNDKVQALKSALIDAAFELGPVLSKEIEAL